MGKEGDATESERAAQVEGTKRRRREEELGGQLRADVESAPGEHQMLEERPLEHPEFTE